MRAALRGLLILGTSAGAAYAQAEPPVSLPPTTTTAPKHEPSDSRLSGYRERLERHAGYFITREQIEKRTTRRLMDALRGVPGARVISLSRSGAGSHSVSFNGASCPPLVFVDGFPATSGAYDLESINLDGLEGVEVYTSAVSTPAELFGPGGPNRCGVIAIWSRSVPRAIKKP